MTTNLHDSADGGKHPPRLRPRPQAAEYLGLKVRTFDKLVKADLVPVLRIGRRVLVDTRDLDRLIDQIKADGGVLDVPDTEGGDA